MSAIIRNFEPTSVWSLPDGTPSPRALGWMRSISDLVGATFGTTPVGTIGGDGVSTTTFYRSDGTFAVPAYPVGANPTASAGISAVNGSAATFMRSDGAPAISQSITPTWTGAHVFSAGITGTTINFSSSITGDSLVATNGFGCNGKTAQTEVTVNAAISDTAGGTYTAAEQTMLNNLKALLNQVRAALVANGICV